LKDSCGGPDATRRRSVDRRRQRGVAALRVWLLFVAGQRNVTGFAQRLRRIEKISQVG
jgi:hypothetical protein